MVPTMVKQCDKEDFRLLTIDQSAAHEEAMNVVVHSFLAAHHNNMDQNRIEEIIDHLRDEQQLSSWEICSCSTHVCILLEGQDCLSRMLQSQALDQVVAELSAADNERIYLKLAMQ